MITFSDTRNNKTWYFETPYMVDANGKQSNEVKLILREEKWKTYVDVVADKTFLEDSNTTYPVKIDPTINDRAEQLQFPMEQMDMFQV